jgi:hypothetical protein
MNILPFGLGFIVGMLVTSFTVIPCLIILVFALPHTAKLKKQGLVKPQSDIVKNYLISLVLLMGIFTIAIALITFFAPSLTIGFVVAIVITVLLGSGNLGENESNSSEYLTKNQQYLDEALNVPSK